MNKLGTASIKKTLLQLAIPMIVAYVVQAMYNIVDTIFVGQAVGSLGIAALGIVFPIQLILSAISMLFASGAATLISIVLGRKETDKAGKIATIGYILALLATFIFMIVTIIGIEPLLQLFGVSAETHDFAKTYLLIIQIGLLFVALTNVVTLVLRAQGKPKYGMILMVVGTILNIVLNPVFVFYFKWGIAGAATATVIAQIVAALMGIYFGFFIKHEVSVKAITKKEFFVTGSEVTKIGLPTFIGTMTFSLVIIVSNIVLGIFSPNSDADIALLSVIMKINELMVLPLFGLIAGMQPLVGFNFGAGKIDRVKETFKVTLTYTCIFLLSCVFIIELFPQTILFVFNSDIQFVQSGIIPLRVVFFFFVFAGGQIACSTYLQSLGHKGSAILISLSRQVIIYFPVLFLLLLLFNTFYPTFTSYAVWLSLPIADLLSGLFGLFLVIKVNRLLKAQ